MGGYIGEAASLRLTERVSAHKPGQQVSVDISAQPDGTNVVLAIIDESSRIASLRLSPEMALRLATMLTREAEKAVR